jgi:Putative zinc- or iron-chelating domain
LRYILAAMNRAERRRKSKDDERQLRNGIDAESSDPSRTAAMTRLLSDLLETAKRDRNIEPSVRFLHVKVDATLQTMRAVRVDCKKGCAHCCRVWVSATIPEVLFIAKAMRRRNDAQLGGRVAAAHRITGPYDFVSRQRLHHQCPLLSDELCSVYEMRPVSCRFWASADVAACLRVFRQSSGETVPTPMSHLKGRGAYEIALSLALKHVGLPHYYYELNAALTRALEREDAESAWLGGEDVFFDVRRDPHDVSTDTVSRQLYKFAFA